MFQLTFPIPPQPKDRPRTSKKGSKPRSTKRTKAYESAITRIFRLTFQGSKPLEGPVDVSMKFFIQAPQYISKVKKKRAALLAEMIPCKVKPDIDNYVKSILDGLNKFAYNDDGQISDITAKKRYSLNPRVEVCIKEVENEHAC